ncbi:hypothetical protein MAMC_00478 [Methylacidimicrobium cyclopophantes]|uniref:VWFA domain-containing protein n=1 Tax=Methylacidimicrobium cyclopophantes TaxID=1041766 RepID=A0A5E6M7F7_9BACT|nr:VWA domain-containing protein [Methylacidimicrobium cyclopophantes]VVM05246.1 hypothetical protein MAMC_00478 [Methylacidimicrobium cyclopophantes]
MIGSLFLRVENVWGLLLLGALPLILGWQCQRARALAKERLAVDPREEAHHWPRQGRRWETVFLCVAVLAAAAGAAGLRWGWKLPVADWHRCEFWLLLDTSLSMRAQDGSGEGDRNRSFSRLEWAKGLCSELFARFPGARFGIVPFAGDASVLSLPSTDRDEFRYYLETASSVPKASGTDLVEPLSLLASEWARNSPSGPMPVLVLLSDGGKEEGKEVPIAKIVETAKEIQALSPRVLFVCLSIGGERGAVVPWGSVAEKLPGAEEFRSTGGFRTARFDPPLESVAHSTGGLFFRAKESSADTICRAVEQRLEKSGLHPERKAASGGSGGSWGWATLGLVSLLLLTTLWSRQ